MVCIIILFSSPHELNNLNASNSGRVVSCSNLKVVCEICTTMVKDLYQKIPVLKTKKKLQQILIIIIMILNDVYFGFHKRKSEKKWTITNRLRKYFQTKIQPTLDLELVDCWPFHFFYFWTFHIKIERNLLPLRSKITCRLIS